jgi:hypothetical protein
MPKNFWVLGMALGLAQFATPVLAAEVFNCRIGVRAGVWQVDDDQLIAPGGAMRYRVIRNEAGALLATNTLSGFEVVILDRRRLSIKTVSVDLANDAERRESGSCAIAEPRVAAAAHAAESHVRPRIRDLVDQARSLASRGFTSAAGLKLRDSGAFARMTDQETDLVNKARLYVASLPRQ